LKLTVVQNRRVFGFFCWLILCGKLAVLQAPMFDGFAFDSYSLFDDGFPTRLSAAAR
jgi:hypothetical protein